MAHEYVENLDYNTTISREEHHGRMDVAICNTDVTLRDKETGRISMDFDAFDQLCELVAKYRKMREVGELVS